MVLLIAAVVAAGFFLRRKPYQYPYLWSQSSPVEMTFENALKYCENLEENGFDDWRLPTLYEIRTVDEKCEEEENSDFCAVTDSCEWDNCESELCGKCLKYADFTGSGTFWTTTETYGGKAAVFTVSSEETGKNISLKNGLHSTKCVRLR